MTFNFNIGKVVSDMVNASSGALAKGGPQAIEYATHEYESFIADIEHVQTMATANPPMITEEEAQFLVNQHKISMQSVLLTVEGLGIIAVQNAINAALAVLNAALSTAVQGLKFAL
jgi:hypothetical protein